MASTPAFGQTASDGVEQLSRNLDDAEASFQYAREAIAAGDIRGAIAALERVLQINPNLANIKLELGLLYLRVGQTDLARSYLESALTSADAPEQARQRARAALRTAESQTGRLGISGSIFAGVQYQTNPNGSPDTVSIVGPFGTPLLVTGDQLLIPRGDDVSGTVSANVEVTYNLGGQSGNQIVADVSFAQNEYRETDELDATYATVRLGPRFYSGGALNPTGYFRPFVSATYLALDSNTYYHAVGSGIAFLAQPTLNVGLSGQVSYERRDYDASPTRRAAPDQTGDYWLGAGEITYQFDPRHRVSLGWLFEKVSARRDFWSRLSYGPQADFTTVLNPIVGDLPWVLRLGGTFRHSTYDENDPQVDPVVARRENRYELEASLNVPLTRAFSLDLRGQQSWNRANLPNYQFKNSFGSLGVNYRF